MAEVVAHSGILKETMVQVEGANGHGRPAPQSGIAWRVQIPALQGHKRPVPSTGDGEPTASLQVYGLARRFYDAETALRVATDHLR